MCRASVQMDTDRGGQVDLSEFVDGLRKLGFKLSPRQVKQVAKVFDADGNGIDYDEFSRFCSCKDVADAVRHSKVHLLGSRVRRRVPFLRALKRVGCSKVALQFDNLTSHLMPRPSRRRRGRRRWFLLLLPVDGRGRHRNPPAIPTSLEPNWR